MRTDAQSRIMSLSFERDPQEHVDVMFAAARRLAQSNTSVLTSMWMFWFFVYAAGFGLAMELYRRYVLVHLASFSTIPAFNILMLQVLPVFILIWLLLSWHNRIEARRSAKAMADRLERPVFVDVDIYRDGIQAATGKTLVQVDWTIIRDIHVLESRIEFESEAWVSFIPFRAFQGREDYLRRAREIRALWQAALKAETTKKETKG
jgi:hypothetical protein